MLWRPALRNGQTLLELLIVIIIIGLLTAAALKAYDTSFQAGRFQATTRQLTELSAAIVGNPDLVTNGVRVDYGFVGDLGMLPGHLEDLVTAPSGLPDPTMWHGPYVLNRVAENTQGYMTDAWGDSLIPHFKIDSLDTLDSLTISSMKGTSYLAPDSWLTLTLARNQNVLLNNTVNGLVLDAKGFPPGNQDTAYLRIVLNYVKGGYHETDTATQVTNGNFKFTGVPIGNHPLYVRWIYAPPSTPPETTTVQATVSVAPGGKGETEVHLPVPFYEP